MPAEQLLPDCNSANRHHGNKGVIFNKVFPCITKKKELLAIEAALSSSQNPLSPMTVHVSTHKLTCIMNIPCFPCITQAIPHSSLSGLPQRCLQNKFYYFSFPQICLVLSTLTHSPYTLCTQISHLLLPYFYLLPLCFMDLLHPALNQGWIQVEKGQSFGKPQHSFGKHQHLR